METVRIIVEEGASVPFKTHLTDACYDIIATSVKDLGNGRIEYGTGLHMTPNVFSQLDLRARSSVHKTGLILSNGLGTGDEGFTGEYKAVFYNIIPSLPNYKVGDRIMQMQVTHRYDIDFQQVNKQKESTRGNGGYGSTDVIVNNNK